MNGMAKNYWAFSIAKRRKIKKTSLGAFLESPSGGWLRVRPLRCDTLSNIGSLGDRGLAEAMTVGRRILDHGRTRVTLMYEATPPMALVRL